MVSTLGPEKARRSAATELEAELSGGTSTSYDSSQTHSQGEIRDRSFVLFRTAMSALWGSPGNGSCVIALITTVMPKKSQD